MEQGNLVKKAWSLLTRDKGWIKPLLVMPIADLVPIVGGMGTHGYALEWARLVAWGVDATPKQKNVQVGKCVGSGARAFVVTLGLGVCISLVYMLMQLIIYLLPDVASTILSVLWGFVWWVFCMVYAIFLPICQIRSSIYESIGAGYRIDRVCQTIGRDVKGFLKILAISIVASLLVSIVLIVLLAAIAAILIPTVIAIVKSDGQQGSIMLLIPLFMVVAILVIIVGYALGVLFHLCTMMMYVIVALWMRQFDLPSWGKSSDPLPAPRAQAWGDQMPPKAMDVRPQEQAFTEQSPTQEAYDMPTTDYADDVTGEGRVALPPEDFPREEPVTNRIEAPKTIEMTRDQTEHDVSIPPADDSQQMPNEDVDSLYSQLNNIIHRDDE